MKIILLDKTQVSELYKTRMVEDFPADELKPLAMILKAMDDGIYECLGLCEGETKEQDNGLEVKEILGYAFFIKLGEDYLFDYLATYPNVRNQGLGAEFLALIQGYYKDARSIIGEVENFYVEKDPDAKALQERRYHFYMRNGLVDTGVKAKLFGVNFLILEVPVNGRHDEEEIKRLYKMHYKRILPWWLYMTKVKI